jgi:hypothetical protein
MEYLIQQLEKSPDIPNEELDEYVEKYSSFIDSIIDK